MIHFATILKEDVRHDKIGEEISAGRPERRDRALYISDLRHSPYHELAIQMLAKTRGGGYTLSEWTEALEYLLLHERCNTVIEAQQVFAPAAKFL